MERIRIPMMSILLTLLMTSGLVLAQQNGQPRSGLSLAEHVCAQCHAIDKGANLSPNAAAPRFEVIANTPGMTATAISAALLTSHRTMPNLILNGGERRDIVAYILSLKRTD